MIVEDLNEVMTIPAAKFEDGKEKFLMGKQFVLTWEERELLDKVRHHTMTRSTKHEG